MNLPEPGGANKKTEKAALRKKMRALRASWEGDARQTAAQKVVKHLEMWPFWPRVRFIHTYLPLAEEMDTWPLIRACWTTDRNVFVPWLPPQGPMQMAALLPETELGQGPMGILQPPQPLEIAQKQYVTAQLNLVLVPGLAFDPQGGRLGYGQGHYDRFLAPMVQKRPRDEHRPLWVLGLGFEAQVLESVPQEAWDIPLGGVVTEKGIITATQKV